MNSFTMKLYDSRMRKSIGQVVSFVGEDASGSFGIQAHHACFMTVLTFGLARYRCETEEGWYYLALPGALLYFSGNTLSLFTRHLLIDRDYDLIVQRLEAELLEEEAQLQVMRESLRQMEESMLRRLWDLGQHGVRLHE